ncbi:TlpA family protein disulfide reductase [Halodesulfovibrio marinisediminis]|uniref:AhpC/TSA family protein n=1 Tax=Halodesulfovibrio marinisediminis DSM 17456 TaxID=1121457 RepID=A0A1N6E3J0_9BACT|nr:TlpA disulfide reductase family protein [Halodesulfovibrio marinisediminis]SIN77586.1 AhpC/TSA family protein [Halodesulfovibrio marinisediminis DSM 17456]
MKSIKSVIHIALLCMAISVLFGAKSAVAEPLKKVDTVEVIKLINSGKGKVTVVNFWASWCPPCREEMPDLVKTRAAFSDDDLLLIGISVDEDVALAEKAVKEFGLNYPVHVAESDVYETFGIQSIPRLLVYDTKGKLVVDHVGPVTFEDLKKLVDEVLKEK